MKVKYLIIGAGVSGLTFANFINTDNYLILEKENEAGGFCRTNYYQDFVWDYAGHFFHFANEDLKSFFSQKINENDIVYKKKITKIYYKGEYIDYPFQKNIHQLPKKEFIDCLYDLFNKTEKNNYIDFEEMLYGRFGKSITEKFLKPYNEKLYACSLSKLDSDAMGRFFPYADIKEIINNMKLEEDTSYNNQFLYPKKGAVTFVNALLNEIQSDKILFKQEVVSIDAYKKIVKTNNMEIEYEYLINTAPFHRLNGYIDEELYNNSMDTLTYNKVLVFNLGFDKKSHIKDFHWVYVPDEDINFYRMGFYDNILDSDKLSMYIEIGYSSKDKVEIEEQLMLTLENLKRMNVIEDHKLVAHSSVIMDPAYVHISQKSKSLKYSREKEFEDKGIYTIGRYGDWKYCSIEDSMVDAIKLVEVFIGGKKI